MASRYDELDEAIKAYIAARPGHHPIYASGLLELAARGIGRDACKGDEKEWRLIDRRMQALKKAGQLAYARQQARWIVVSS